MKIYNVIEIIVDNNSYVEVNPIILTINEKEAQKKLEELRDKHQEKYGDLIEELLDEGANIRFDDYVDLYAYCDEDGNEYIVEIQEHDLNLKTIIELEGGLVQNIYSNANHNILLIDRDVEGADEDEIISKKYVDNFIDNEKLESIEFDGGIYTEDINLNN